MVVLRDETVAVTASEDVVVVRQKVREMAVGMGFSLVDQTKIVTAASEIARNTLKYGGGGTARLQACNDGRRLGLRMIFEDRGPGIADLELAMRDGYSSAGGLGLGLGGARRLSNEFDIKSRPGEGVCVTLGRWK